MYKTIIAIDLETTGINPANDDIIEMGAAVMHEGKLAATFNEFCATEKTLSPSIIKLTGIKPKMLDNARHFHAILPDFLDFLAHEDALYIAHNAAFDLSFLREKSEGLFKHRILDTVGLSRICFPALASHSLGFLVSALGITHENEHRALGDCQATLALWSRLSEELMNFPPELITAINKLIAPLRTHPYHDLFQRLGKTRFAESFGKSPSPLARLFRNHKEIIETKAPVRDLEREHGRLDLRQVEKIFSSEGALSKVLPGFEAREGQREMAIEVAQVFSEDRHLMVEAPTGIGKSLAYLVPAALFAAREDFPVILSTNTKNLQSQLFEKDIPLVKKAVGLDFKSAILKGRGNYLCLRKLFYVLDTADRELDRDERMQMVTLLSWALKTETGDISECVLTGRPNFAPLWAKLRTLGDECLGRACNFFHRCFLRKARSLALQADLVVVNHALVFAEMNMESPALPEYRQIVFDEAHNLEAAATGHLTVEISHARLYQVLARLYRSRRRKGGTGLLASILASLNSDACNSPPGLAARCAKNCTAIMNHIEIATAAIEPFLQSLNAALPARKGPAQKRFSAVNKPAAAWEKIEENKTLLVSALAMIMRGVEAAVENLGEMPSGSMPYLRDFQRELEAVVTWLREVISDLEFVLAGSESNYVYWLERVTPKRGNAVIYAAPLAIAEIMHDQVYSRKRSCIFSSATLTVKGRFDFLAGRLGISRIPRDRIISLRAHSPFNYQEQCLIAAPIFLPELSGGGDGGEFIEALSELLVQVYRKTKGRGLALFTSYSMLRSCYNILQKKLLGDGINVLAQGESGSREGITARFMRDIHSVLLGTHSFWEGVDVVGESLSCLTIARLPFAVFTDPVVEARCEQVEQEGKGSFMHYSVPNAVIRFKQGFGRLVRSTSDRGLVIIADRRVATRRYGKVFLDSLPAGTQVFTERETFLEAVEAFFER